MIALCLAILSILTGVTPTTAQAIDASLVHEIIYNGDGIRSLSDFKSPRWTVRIKALLQNAQSSYCTGVLISKDFVLTAGHCVAEASSIDVELVRRFEPLKTRKQAAAAWKASPDFEGGEIGSKLSRLGEDTAYKYADLGLIRLEHAAFGFEPITVRVSKPNTFVDLRPAYVIGLERDEDYVVQDAFATLKLVNQRWIGASKSVVATLRGGDWCVRDSGGPVVISTFDEAGEKELQLVGIAFAFFDKTMNERTSRLKKIWGSLEKVPGCGRRVGYLHVGKDLSWIRTAMDEMLPGSSSQIRIRE